MTTANLTTVLLPAGISHQDMTELIYIYFTFPSATGHHLYPFRMVSLESAPSIHPVLSVSSRLSCCISPLVLYMRCSHRKPQTNVAPPRAAPPASLSPSVLPSPVLKLLKMATGMRALLDTVVQALPQVCLICFVTHTHTHASIISSLSTGQSINLINICGMINGQPGQKLPENFDFLNHLPHTVPAPDKPAWC